jgi:hypothetical protein
MNHRIPQVADAAPVSQVSQWVTRAFIWASAVAMVVFGLGLARLAFL